MVEVKSEMQGNGKVKVSGMLRVEILTTGGKLHLSDEFKKILNVSESKVAEQEAFHKFSFELGMVDA